MCESEILLKGGGRKSVSKSGKKLHAALVDLEKAYDKSQLGGTVGRFKGVWCQRKTA